MAKSLRLLALLIIALQFSAGVYANGETDGRVMASAPNECYSRTNDKGPDFTPINCVFLEEPIGGQYNYDLFYVECQPKEVDGKTIQNCKTISASSPNIPLNAHGPIQAILSSDPDKIGQGPFGLLYSYLGLIYGYMSGLIVGLAILFVVIGGIKMTTAAGDQNKVTEARTQILKALLGMILWFLASLILYTINPTFFTF